MSAAGSQRDTDPIRVSLYSGIYMRHDAVSDSLRHKLAILRRLVSMGAPLEVTVFTHASDDPGPELCPVASVSALQRLERFWSTDVHLFEFGMHYDLFDSVYVIPEERPIVVFDHNTTPPALVDLPEARAGCERALVQRHNLQRADRVVCVSEFTVELVRSVGVSQERISVLHLPPTCARARRPSRARRPQDVVRLLFVGRFVRAKGVGDLLEVCRSLWAPNREGRVPTVTLTMVGGRRFSDPAVIERIEGEQAALGAERLEVVWSPSNDELASIYERSDALVIPSFHEGYCVPVVEALWAGCQVLGYDAGNLPNVIGEVGQVVPTGDVEALRAALWRIVEGLRGRDVVIPTTKGLLDPVTWERAVSAHLADYSPSAFERGFLEVLEEVVSAAGVGAGARHRLRTVIAARRAELDGIDLRSGVASVPAPSPRASVVPELVRGVEP